MGFELGRRVLKNRRYFEQICELLQNLSEEGGFVKLRKSEGVVEVRQKEMIQESEDQRWLNAFFVRFRDFR